MKRLILLCCLLLPIVSRATDYRGAQFLAYSDLSKFTREGPTLTSPIISPAINWDELILSWNLRGSGQAAFEARVIYPDATTPYYQLAVWSARERHTITNQADQFAAIALDTLVIQRPGGKLQARIRLTDATPDDLKYLAFSFADTKAKPDPLPPNRHAWRKTLNVDIRSQLDFPDNHNLCSPTGVSMILEYWARKLHRRELNLTVPQMAKRVYDVARLTDISELEDWIQAGIPVATSVSLNRLEDQNKTGKGHLVVCVGFDKRGDIMVNDPGAPRDRARRTFSRERFRAAWADSNNTVYLTYPEGTKIHEPKFGHWE